MRSDKPEISPILSRVSIEHFKAIRRSGDIFLKPFTVFIGDNGGGKTSILEALQAYRNIVLEGLDAGFSRLGGIEAAWNRRAFDGYSIPVNGGTLCDEYLSKPIRFNLSVKVAGATFRTGLSVSATADLSRLGIVDEFILDVKRKEKAASDAPSTTSILSRNGGETAKMLRDYFLKWQFLSMNPDEMRRPMPLSRANGRVELLWDAGNIAEYLLGIRNRHPHAYETIVEKMKLVLPYLSDIRPSVSPEFNMKAHLKIIENTYEIPGWAASTGTLRILALVALLHDPEGPQLIAIDEIENGLDPGSVHFLVGQIRNAAESGRTQVIATSHSPFFINALSLDEVIVVERGREVARSSPSPDPTFWSPGTSRSCQRWAESFATGDIYTMDLLHKDRSDG